MGSTLLLRARAFVLPSIITITSVLLTTGCQSVDPATTPASTDDSPSSSSADVIEPAGADNGDQFLTLDDDPPADDYRIVANVVDPAAPQEWNFQIAPVVEKPMGNLRFEWDFGLGDGQTFEGADQAFTFPEGGTYVITVTAFHGSAVAFVLTLELEVPAMPEQAPIPNAGDDQVVNEGGSICLDGSDSTDPNGDSLSFIWRQVAGPPVLLAESAMNQAMVCFNAPQVDDDTRLIFILKVNDGAHEAEDSVFVDVLNLLDSAATVIADAGEDFQATAGQLVTLDGSASSASDGSELTWQWRQTNGEAVALDHSDGAIATFIAPSVPQTLTFELTVSVGEAVATDVVTVTIVPATGGGGGNPPPPAEDLCPDDPDKTEPGACGCGIPDTDSDADGVADCIDECPGGPDQDTDGDGVLDCVDSCPSDANKTEPGICGCGANDADSDGDGIADCNDQCPGQPDTDSDGDGALDCADACPADPNKVVPGACGCGASDADSDGDGVADCHDQCPGEADVDSDGDGTFDCEDECPDDPRKTSPGICGCGVRDVDFDGDGVPNCNDECPGQPDVDSDGDGTLDCDDLCPADPAKIEPGICGCGVGDQDSDGDGVADCNDDCPASTDSDGDGTQDCDDGCPSDPNKTEPGVCGCGVDDVDSDGDGVPDCNDACPGQPDVDSDGDGLLDCNDGCPTDPNKIEPGTCGCGVADADNDGDGVPNCNDACPGSPDVDSDGDGVLDCDDGCPSDPDKLEPGICGCGVADADSDGDGVRDCNDVCPGEADLDSDGDGLLNCEDGCPNDPNKVVPGVCGCGVSDDDADNDGVPNCNDQCPGAPDIDSDGDGALNCEDSCPTDAGKTEPGVCGCGVADTDADGNGQADCLDPHDVNVYDESFESFACGAELSDWFDTDAGNSLAQNDSLFRTKCVGATKALGTSSSATNIHSHYVAGGSENWAGYTFTGRMMMTSASSGIGVTFFSDYPNSDRYYRLRRGNFTGGTTFHVDQHPDGAGELSGTTNSGVLPSANVWYQFKIEVEDTGSRTEIRAKVWPDGGAEPADWQIDCYDSTAGHRSAGRIGVWSMAYGSKYWDDLNVALLDCDLDSDGDGANDCADLCPSDPDKTAPGVCGCNAEDVDSDGDGALDCNDACPADAAKTTPGQCGCGQADTDSDGDGVADCNDECPGQPDGDSDGDGTADCADQCPDDPGKVAPGSCGCGTPDTDSDGDGTPDCQEPPSLCASNTTINFGATADQLTFDVWNCGTGALNYTVSDNAAWLSVSPSSGSSAGETNTMVATVDRAGLAEQSYQAEITVTPSTGTVLTIAVSMIVQAPTGEGLTPIARWDVVPYQRISQGETFNCGVVAFSKNGIQKVRFLVNGGSPVDVYAMSRNDRTSVDEYWAPIAASSFGTAGQISVDATVYGADGGTRTLDTLHLVVDADGTLARPEAWVDATVGSDSTGMVNISGRPFKTIGKAMDAIRAWMSANGHGNRVDGGIVRLKPGTHVMDNGGIWDALAASQEWITITTATGGNRDNTKIFGKTSAMPNAGLVRCAGITIQSSGQWNYVFEPQAGTHLWIDDCNIIGSGRHTRGSNPVRAAAAGTVWFTDSYIYNVDFAVGGGEFARGLTIEHIGDDAFQHCPFIVNCTADDVDPGDTGWHTDAWQWFATSGPNNTIVYNYRFTDAHYQSVMCRTGVPGAQDAKCVAFVNFYSEMEPPSRKPNGPASLWERSADHFLLWNCTFVDHPFNIYDDSPSIPTRITNFDVRGCCFDTLKHATPLGNVDFSSFADNHFVVSSGVQVIAPGSGVTVGSAGLDSFGRPTASSPLRDRLSPPPIGCDASGRIRDAVADVGAYEH